ncbi:hypothetical protein JCM6882_004078 [Rhodosporidiobolus microsporus]
MASPPRDPRPPRSPPSSPPTSEPSSPPTAPSPTLPQGEGSSHARTSSRVFPFSRAAVSHPPNSSVPSGSQPLASPPLSASTTSRPSFVSRPSSRPNFISLPSAAIALNERGFPSPHNFDVQSPSGYQSVSSADGSASSRVAAPDLGGTNARYFPMRSVMYPSASSAGSGSIPAASTGGGGTGHSVTSSARSTGSSRDLHGPASRADAPVGGAGSVEPPREEANAGRAPEALDRGGIEHAAKGLGMQQEASWRSREGGKSSVGRPAVERGSSSRTAGARSGASGGSRDAPSQVSSDAKPPSLDPFLSEPTTHAKHDDPPSSDEEERGGLDDDDVDDAASQVQEHDFVEDDVERLRRKQQEEQEGGNRVAAEGASTSMTGASDKPLLMTTRFEHQITEGGDILVLTGREGELERCEDEPIHAPGAVQAFGVLIAFDLEEDGRMIVQQVSENSGFILGLPPRTLFRAKCLSNILDEDEEDALRDALELLEDRDSDPTNEEEGPYTFTLSGRGNPGTGDGDALSRDRLEWTCHAAIHRPSPTTKPKRVVLELELVDDQLNPLTTVSSEPFTPDERGGMADLSEYGENGINPTEADLIESTVSIVKPLRTLTRLKERQKRRGGRARSTKGMGEMDIVGLLSQINDQLGKADDLETFLRITAGLFRELTEFDRVMIYQFDEAWNGRVVAEQVDWSRTRDLFRGLNFPASDIPAQARELYRINKVRLLYDRDQPTARLCCRSVEEVDSPLDMTHCHLRAMSPIHIKYLGNMGVRSSMSVSITAFGDLWGLISMHTYGRYGHRISFPVRQLCKLLGQSISRNIERISYATRLQARKLINTATTDQNPSGYIVAKAEDLLDLFHADFGILSIGDEAKILGPVSNSQELLAVLEYLRIKQFISLKASQDIRSDFPDIDYPNGFQLIAGLLMVPLSTEGKDFIVFFRKGQLQTINWAGNPHENKTVGDYRPLEPRRSFKVWSETVQGKSRAWTDEEKETANVLCLVYGKFIAVWREKESALAASQLTNLLLQNASHEVRTPLNAIINYLELALDGPIQGEVRDNLVRSHAASKSLIHVINDLLDLTRTEKGNELFLTDPFNLAETLDEALAVHRSEAQHRNIALDIVEQPTGTPPTVIGDRAKIRQIVTNVVANALKHTQEGGTIMVEWGEIVDQDVADALEAKQDSIRIGISITDTGAGISEEKLEGIFRQFEQVSTIGDKARDEAANSQQGVGLGLAVVARIVRNLNGQLQVESKVGEGSKFTFIFPFRLPDVLPPAQTGSGGETDSTGGTSRPISEAAVRDPLIRRKSNGSAGSTNSSGPSDIDSLIQAMSTSGMGTGGQTRQGQRKGQPQGKASSLSSRSANSARSTRSIGSSNLGSGGGGMSAINHKPDSSTRPGQVGVTGASVPLRASRVPPASGGGETTISPVSSPLHHPRSPSSPSYFVQPGPGSSPLAPSGLPAPPQLRRSSTAAATIGSPMVEHPPSRSIEDVVSPTGVEESPSTSGAATAVGSGQTPRPLSPEPDAKPGASSEKVQHISEFRRSPVTADDHIEPMRVLVVEDEMVNRMIISQRLKKDGHEVVVAEHGGVAVRKFEEDRNFDVVLMDLQMPTQDGRTATRNIRRIEQESPTSPDEQRPSTTLNRGIPVLAVTASLPERDRHTIIEAGLNGWLLKPIDFKRLKQLMRGAVDVDARADEIYQPGQWERGGWLTAAPSTVKSSKPKRTRSSHSNNSTASGLAISSPDLEA